MKKTIIAIAIILTSCITAYSLSARNAESAVQATKIQTASFASPNGNSQKSDLATAD